MMNYKDKPPVTPVTLREVLVPLCIFIGVMVVLWAAGIVLLHFGFGLSFDDIYKSAKPRPLHNPIIGK